MEPSPCHIASASASRVPQIVRVGHRGRARGGQEGVVAAAAHGRGFRLAEAGDEVRPGREKENANFVLRSPNPFLK